MEGIEVQTLLEMQVHTEPGLQAKEQETNIFENRRTIAGQLYDHLRIKNLSPSDFTFQLENFVKDNLLKNRPLTQHSVSNFLKRLKLNSDLGFVTKVITEYEELFDKSLGIFENADMLFNNKKELVETRAMLERLVNSTQSKITNLRQTTLVS